MRKIAKISIAACIAAGAAVLVLKKSDMYHTAERRAWKDEAVVSIAKDLEAKDYLQNRFGTIPKPMGEFEASEDWLISDTIVCRDAAWLAFRAITHKVEPEIHDIFIAKASDGKWYYSDYHFCREMMVLASDDQPDSLAQFRDTYRLVEFDGSSDEALSSTIDTARESATLAH